MRRLKEYINKHPKLKRIAKILGVIAIVFSFLFNALIIGSLIINANKANSSNKVLAYAETSPTQKSAIEDRFAVFYSYGDFMSPLFAESTFEILCDSDNIALTGLNGTDFLNGREVRFQGVDVLYGALDTNGEHITWRDGWTFPVFSIQYMSSSPLPSYRISFRMVNGSNIQVYDFFYTRYSSYNENNELIYFNWSTSLVVHYSADNGNNFIVVEMGRDNSQTYFAIPKSNYFNWIGTEQNQLNDYYNKGYVDGLSYGKEVGETTGYEDGYNIGYYDGLQSAEEGETTMFTLITRAFNAVASILDIQILPNLSLGLLIFTPLIVTIIIVIVKMVKG